jgi:transposase
LGDGLEKLPEEIEALQAALVAARAEVAIVRAQQSDDRALIAHLKLQIEKLLARSAQRGSRSA